MDILAGMLAYVAGLAAFFGALAVAFFVFVAGPKEALQTQAQPQSASAMLVRPSTANKPAVEARAKYGHSAKHAVAASSPAPTPPPSHEASRKPAASSAQARRLQEERARRWAYQQDSNFKSRFLGYAD